MSDSLAKLIHDELCNDTPRCARRGTSISSTTAIGASAIIGALEPKIGIANVFTAVRAIIGEDLVRPRADPCRVGGREDKNHDRSADFHHRPALPAP